MKKISELALMTFKGINSSTVKEIFPEIIIKAEELKKENKNYYYVGTKNTNVISLEFINSLEEIGLLHHTIDFMAEGGRAVDIRLQNPITGRFMTGSSSATAINVFNGINDIGIGTDGGGSILAPALSLNLYGFISNLFDKKHVSKFYKESTDGIGFSPSIGLISKDLEKIEYVIENTLLKENRNKQIEKIEDVNIKIAKPNFEQQKVFYDKVLLNLDELNLENISLSYDSSNRKKMIEELSKIDFDNEILITFEGPIDLYEYGDSIMGHYSKYTRERQELAHKYYLKVVNMLNLTAIAIPSSDLSLGLLIICKSEVNKINKVLEISKKIEFKRSILEEKYFN